MLPGEFEDRTSDVIWKVGWKGGEKRDEGREVYLLILVELQSSCEQAMVLRVLAYIVMLYLRLIKERPLKKGELLPAVLPLIVYNGEVEWWAPLRFEDRDVHDLTSFAETNMVNFIEQAEARGEARGRQEGRQEGEARGRQEGLAEAVLRLLARKFGAVPEDVRARVLAAEADSLSLWIDRILTASSIPEVFRNEAPPS